MALPKSKSRKIIVSGIVYRYAVSITWIEGENYIYDLNITVQSESNGSKLIVQGVTTRDFWIDISDYPEDLSLYKVVTPKHIERLINIAKEKGWEHSEKGKNFHLKTTNEEVGNLTKRSI